MLEGSFITIGTMCWYTERMKQAIDAVAVRHQAEMARFPYPEVLQSSSDSMLDADEVVYLRGWHISGGGSTLSRAYWPYSENSIAMEFCEGERPVVESLPEPFSTVINDPIYRVGGDSAFHLIRSRGLYREEEWRRDWQHRLDFIEQPWLVWTTYSELVEMGWPCLDKGFVTCQE